MNAPRLILFLAAAEIGIVGLIYLFAPLLILAANGMTLDSVNDYHATRAAYGGAFTGFGLLFLTGALNASLRRPALIALFTFMSGFALGRIYSLAVDGMPAPTFLIVLCTEILLAGASLWALQRE